MRRRRSSSRAESRNPTEFLVLRESSLKKEGEALEDDEQEEDDVTDSRTSVGLTTPRICVNNYL